MERTLFILLLVSGSLCTGNYSYLGTGTSLAVCQPDTCALLSEVATMKEKLGAMAQTQGRLEQSLSTMVQKMATVEANLQHYKTQAEQLWKVNQEQDEQLRALKDIATATNSKVAFTVALGVSVGPFQRGTPIKISKDYFQFWQWLQPCHWYLHCHGPGGVLLQIYNVQQQLRTAQFCGVPDEEQPVIGDNMGHHGQ